MLVNRKSKVRGGKTYNQHTSYKYVILWRDGFACKVCGCAIGETCGKHAPVKQLDVAHIIPFNKGGPSTPNNQRTLCHSCNCMERESSLEHAQRTRATWEAEIIAWAHEPKQVREERAAYA